MEVGRPQFDVQIGRSASDPPADDFVPRLVGAYDIPLCGVLALRHAAYDHQPQTPAHDEGPMRSIEAMGERVWRTVADRSSPAIGVFHKCFCFMVSFIQQEAEAIDNVGNERVHRI
jgi:hypothetical protein